MKRLIENISVFSILIAIVILLAGCSKDINYKLQIKESSWSGWTKDYEPEERTNEYDVVLDKEYNIDSGNLVFTIKKIKSNYIVIKTTEPFSDSESGIDLESKKTEFKIKVGEELKLETPTMDAGEIYYFNLIEY